MSTILGCFCWMKLLSAATTPSGSYPASFGDSIAYTLATFLPAISWAMAPTPAPKTAASTVPPVSAAMACAAATVSHETRFNLPSRCSATTRIVSAMVFAIEFSESLPLLLDVANRDQHQGQKNVYAEQGAHQRASGFDVPLHEEAPASRANQHNQAGDDQG